MGFSFQEITVAALNIDISCKNFEPLTKLINRKLEEDQGNAFRVALGQVLPQLEDAYQEKDIQFRSHMGASLLGKQCKRDVWYSFNWVKEQGFSGRMIRLFNRGHLEEGRFIALLQQAGIQTWFKKEDGGQFAFSNARGHYGGSLDIVVKGIPQFEDIPMLCECKTHSEKSFTKLMQVGVADAKPEHLIQMNQYMGHYSLSKAVYFAVNKNTDEIYCEIVDFNQTAFDRELVLATTLVNKRTPPSRISKERSYYLCKNCSYKEVCWNNVKPQITCRTCKFVEVADGGKWSCNKHNISILTKEMQYLGCLSYTLLDGFNS
jgi:ribosomal protein S27E